MGHTKWDNRLLSLMHDKRCQTGDDKGNTNPSTNSNLCQAVITYESKIHTAQHITGIIHIDDKCSAMPVTMLAAAV